MEAASDRWRPLWCPIRIGVFQQHPGALDESLKLGDTLLELGQLFDLSPDPIKRDANVFKLAGQRRVALLKRVAEIGDAHAA
jgi:hypothetical protein